MKRFLMTSLAAIAVTAAANAAAAAEDLKQAATDFAVYCAPCHGLAGKGDGPAASALKIRPADLTAIARRRGGTFPEAAIFEQISGLDMPDSHGSREMPVWGDVFVGQAVGSGLSLEDARRAAAATEQRIAGLVAYLRSIQEP